MTDWSEEKPSLDLVKTMVTMPEVVEMMGYEIDRHGKITSPWNPDERTPSCHVYEDHIYDYSTGQFADMVDFVQLHDPDISFGKAVWMLWNKSLRAGREPGDVEHSTLRTVEDFSEQLPGLPLTPNWSTWLGCPLPKNLECSGDGATLLIPHEDEDGVYGVKTRTWDGAKGAWPGSQFTKRLYSPQGWNYHWRVPTCVLTEGESDCWHVDAILGQAAAQVDVFALPSGAGSWRDSWLKDLEAYDRVILVMDNDRAGEAARDKLRGKIGWLRVEDLYVPALYNDVREAVANGWDGHQLLDLV